ncbi:cupin domain-containing protein [Amycolatopsis sp. NPDC059657]|uniref:cupin domain-containing protein n=1 Tax=Amycolatopsis sp. NPDC059657 TaxID=3346899 RepID=UPI003672D46B
MEIRKLDRERLGPDNNHSQRLVPWDALNAPFEGAWNVIRPGTSSVKHAHHEYEIFIAISGKAILESQGERTEFVPGDVVHFPPHTDHQVINDGDEDFQMYSVWWDKDMTERFAERDR